MAKHSNHFPEEDDEEYELLPPDEEVVHLEKTRRSEEREEIRQQIESTVDPFESPYSDLDFRFQIIDLLILTACVAVGLTVFLLAGPCFSLLVFLFCIVLWLQFRILMEERNKKLNPADCEEGLATAEGKTETPSSDFWDVDDFKSFLKDFTQFSVADLFLVTTVMALLFTLIKLLSFNLSWTTAIVAAIFLGGVIAYKVLGYRPSPRWWRLWFLLGGVYLVLALILTVQKQFQ